MRAASGLLAICVTACFHPSKVQPCSVRCGGAAGECPEGLSCLAGYCAAGVDDADTCGTPIDANTTCTSAETPALGAYSVDVVAGNSSCNPDAILVTDGLGAGLPAAAAGYWIIDGVTVTSCVAADFGSLALGDHIRVRARRADACGGVCTACDRPAAVLVLQSPTTMKNALTFIGQVPLDDTFSDGELVVTSSDPTQFIVVCRPADGPAGADVEVDSIRICRP